MSFRRHIIQIAACAIAGLALAPRLLGSGEPRWIPGMPTVQPWTGTPAVQTLAVFDDGSGPRLYAGGEYITPAGPPSWGLARWNGSEWSPVGSGLNSGVRVLKLLNDGSGPALFAGVTDFGTKTTGWDIVKWDGALWSGVTMDLEDFSPLAVCDIAIYDDGRGGGPSLIAAGLFGSPFGPIEDCVARWTGSSWQPLGQGLQSFTGFLVAFALCVEDDDHGNGSTLVVAGHFDMAGTVAARNVARWNGADWTSLGAGPAMMTVLDITPYEVEMQGPDQDVLIAVGTSPDRPGQGAAVWDGETWSDFGPPEVDSGYSIAELTVGQERGLYIAGAIFPNGASESVGVAKWNGQSWDALGAGLTDPRTNGVAGWCLESFADGASHGPALFVGGVFDAAAGGYPAVGIARWGVPVQSVCVPDIAPSGGDGRINIADMLQVIGGWGTCDHPCGSDCVPDLDGSCAVNITDLLAVIGQWGPCPGSIWE